MKIQGPGAINPIRDIGSYNSVSHTRTIRDQASLSTAASAMADTRGPEMIDMHRVERLTRAIESGSFKVNADEIAGRMMQEEVG